MVSSLLTRLAFAILPGNCILCCAATRREADICLGCQSDLAWIRDRCNRCGVPLSAAYTLCGRCLMAPPVFDTCFTPFVYAQPVDRLIAQFKHQHRLIVGHILSELTADAWLAHDCNLPDLLVPVPLHKDRRRSRGFNQAEEIAKVLSRRAGIPLDNQSCTRVIATPDQKALTATERQKNLRQAFRLNKTLKGASVGIVDDVVTTAATVTEIARLIRAAGADRITIIALARTSLT